jgi:hypothetical protein
MHWGRKSNSFNNVNADLRRHSPYALDVIVTVILVQN